MHWTVGKLNCQHCGARLGGFNFLNCSKCPCGLDTSVHLSKSRVDLGSRPLCPSRPGVDAGRTTFKDGELRAPADPIQASPLLPHIPTLEELNEMTGSREMGLEELELVEHDGSEPGWHVINIERHTGTEERNPQSEINSGSVMMLTKRGKNRLKNFRRKQRKRERWMQRKREEEEQVKDYLE